MEKELPVCSSKIYKFADLIPNWQKMANQLELREHQITDIRQDHQLTDSTMKSSKVLNEWHRINGYKASYRVLVDACIKQRDLVLAEGICKVIKGMKIFFSVYST